MSDKTGTREQTFGIGAVARLTGLTDHTIRVWERRYQAVVAERAANGRRVYRSSDIEKLKLLKLLTDQGLSIGRIAGESLQQLRVRAEAVRELATAAPAVREVRVGVFGELLPALVKAEAGGGGPLVVVAADNLEERFLADVRQQPVDVVIVELPVIGLDTPERLERLKSAAGTDKAVLIYGFAQSSDVADLRKQGVVLLRAPITADEAVQAAVRAVSGQATATASALPAFGAAEAAIEDDGPVEPRLFSQQQLSALAKVSNTIECECPQHLAELVGALSAFEIYSANCASRNEDDTVLHRYLHRTTARARALIEHALDRVAREEGLI